MTQPTTQDREAWLIEAGDYISRDLIAPIASQYGLDLPPVRYSVGFPLGSKGQATKTLGQCFARAASADGHNEIFITPLEADSLKVLATLVHELIHAFLDNTDGHKGRFRRIATAVGLEGKMTATTASDALAEKLSDYIDLLGPIPHAAIDVSLARKKQTTRYIKVACTAPDCGFVFRTSQTQIDRFSHNTCLVCAQETLEVESV